MLTRWLLAPPSCRDLGRLREAVQGKTILLTGASFGIGEATALLLAQAGAEVLLLARSADKLQHLANQIRALGGQATAYPTDFYDPATIAVQVARIEAAHPRIDVVISNAGKSIRRPVLGSAQRDDLGRSLAVNFSSPAALLLALLPRMVAQGGGQVISVSTVSVRQPGLPRWASYQGSKAGFDVWLGSLGNELAADGLKVSRVYLPLVRTRMSAPTRIYRYLPALTAVEAAQAVVYPLLRPVARTAPWWLPWLEVWALLFPRFTDRLLCWMESLERRVLRRRS